MKKLVFMSVILVLAVAAAEAGCCGQARGGCNQVVVGGRCRQFWGSIQSTENAPWKVVPYDIQMLSDDSLVKQRYVKCFDLVTKSIKSWTEWGEFRAKLAEMNLTYANNQVCAKSRR